MFELTVVQTSNEVIHMPNANVTSGMGNTDALTTDGNTLQFPSSYHPQRETFAINSNIYTSITNRQHDYDTVEHVFGNTVSSEIQPKDTETAIPITRATMIYVLCAALNSCNLGYDIGVSTNVSKLIQNDIRITDAQREIWIGFINFWASKWRCSVYLYTLVCILIIAMKLYLNAI
jgi:hypothetical protein